MFGETTIFHERIWNHPMKTTNLKWLFRVPGMNKKGHFIFSKTVYQVEEDLWLILTSCVGIFLRRPKKLQPPEGLMKVFRLPRGGQQICHGEVHCENVLTV